MNAESLTKALAGRWGGSSDVARGAGHDDRTPSLSVSEGQDGKILVKGHAACEQDPVIDALKARGLCPCSIPASTTRCATTKRAARAAAAPAPLPNQAHAIEIRRASRDTIGTLTAAYLPNRAITCTIPASIRDHPGLKHGPTGLNLPAMVAAIIEVCESHSNNVTVFPPKPWESKS